MLWVILTLMAVFAAVGLTIPLVRRVDAARAAQRNDSLGVLKDQLGEIETQAATGVLAGAEADALKVDLKRRVLAEGRRPEAEGRPLSERTLLYLALGTVAIVTLAGTGLYLVVGRPDVAAAPGTPQAAGPAVPGAPPHADGAAAIAQLEAQMQRNPDNAEGWRMLAGFYLQTGRAADAATAYGRAVALDPKNPEYLAAQGEAMVMAGEGSVTPQAKAVFGRALAADPQSAPARFYMAMAKDQAGDFNGAINDWITLLKSAEPGAPWADGVRDTVMRKAAERNIDVTGRLPPAQQAEAGPARGPTQEQMAAAQGMSEGERAQMIEGMVSGLAAKLKQNPRDLAGWQQLMRARMVQGKPGEAQAALREATRAFAGSPGDQQALRQSAQQAGVPGA